jgi:hypothetical protein
MKHATSGLLGEPAMFGDAGQWGIVVALDEKLIALLT